MNVRLLIVCVAALWMMASTAGAAPYWIAYEGNDYPENEGWWRGYSGGGAERTIEDGVLVLDGLADLGINDIYGYNQYPIDPGLGELFVAEFRFAIDDIISGPDPGIALFSDESWAVMLSFSDDSIRSELENNTFEFDFVGFHAFRLTSGDMRTYTLEADGEVIHEGVFNHVISDSLLSWGDAIEGGASLTRWDYMRFGVVPEPSCLFMFIILGVHGVRRRGVRPPAGRAGMVGASPGIEIPGYGRAPCGREGESTETKQNRSKRGRFDICREFEAWLSLPPRRFDRESRRRGGLLGGEGRSGVDEMDRTTRRKETRSMRNHLLLMLSLAALGATALPAGAAPYWIAYEGNDFPENEGWERGYSGGGAERWIEDGMLVIDGLADLGINDYYGYGQYPIDPGPGELFVAELRFAIDEIISGPDPGFALFSDESWAVGFSFSDDHIRTAYDHEIIEFDFVGFHTFRLTSSDMRSYQLEADGEVLFEGAFTHVISASHLSWGDGVQGGASLTRWDHVRFGVVPEPCTLILAIITTLTLVTSQRR